MSLAASPILRDICLLESPEITRHQSDHFQEAKNYEGVTDMRGFLDSEEKRSI